MKGRAVLGGVPNVARRQQHRPSPESAQYRPAAPPRHAVRRGPGGARTDAFTSLRSVVPLRFRAGRSSRSPRSGPAVRAAHAPSSSTWHRTGPATNRSGHRDDVPLRALRPVDGEHLHPPGVDDDLTGVEAASSPSAASRKARNAVRIGSSASSAKPAATPPEKLIQQCIRQQTAKGADGGDAKQKMRVALRQRSQGRRKATALRLACSSGANISPAILAMTGLAGAESRAGRQACPWAVDDNGGSNSSSCPKKYSPTSHLWRSRVIPSG